jgi:hypothetical protein
MRMVFTDTQYGIRLPPYVDEYPYPYQTAPWLGYSQRYIHTLSHSRSHSLLSHSHFRLGRRIAAGANVIESSPVLPLAADPISVRHVREVPVISDRRVS